MKLRTPEQSENKDGVFPNHPRKVKKWLANLPHANMGEMTRQIFSAVRESNRSIIPAKQRLEILEMLRDPCRSIFDNLKKYFVNRTFPLPEKSKKIVNLNQALLQEIALGYKIIAQQAASGSEKVNDKTKAIALLRAISYQSELLLRASEIYASVPANTWHDSHQLFSYAVNTKLHRKTIDDNESPNKKPTIEDKYKQMLLFSLSRPTAMRQSDSERVYNKLYHWVTHTNLGVNPQENQINQFFCVRTEEDQPPSYLSQRDCDNNNPIYTLETSALVEHIRQEVSQAKEIPDTIAVGDELSIETLKNLILSWGAMPKRRFSRTGQHGEIEVSIGLSSASKAISQSNLPEALEAMSESFDAESSFSLEHIPDELKAMADESSAYMTHTEIGNNQDNAWDMVARGSALTEAFDKQRKQQQEESLKLNKEDDDLHWEIVNISAGGYCLRWNSINTSKAQIGEIIAIHERETNGNYEWRIGAIRWMQFTSKSGLEIGVQILSPKVMAANAKRFNRVNESPFEALMIPGIRPLNQAASIILPAHAFKTGDKLKLEVFAQNIDIKLNGKKEHTGSFTQFEFITANKKTQKKNTKHSPDTSKEKDDFDEIWSSL